MDYLLLNNDKSYFYFFTCFSLNKSLLLFFPYSKYFYSIKNNVEKRMWYFFVKNKKYFIIPKRFQMKYLNMSLYFFSKCRNISLMNLLLFYEKNVIHFFNNNYYILFYFHVNDNFHKEGFIRKKKNINYNLFKLYIDLENFKDCEFFNYSKFFFLKDIAGDLLYVKKFIFFDLLDYTYLNKNNFFDLFFPLLKFYFSYSYENLFKNLIDFNKEYSFSLLKKMNIPYQESYFFSYFDINSFIFQNNLFYNLFFHNYFFSNFFIFTSFYNKYFFTFFLLENLKSVTCGCFLPLKEIINLFSFNVYNNKYKYFLNFIYSHKIFLEYYDFFYCKYTLPMFFHLVFHQNNFLPFLTFKSILHCNWFNKFNIIVFNHFLTYLNDNKNEVKFNKLLLSLF